MIKAKEIAMANVLQTLTGILQEVGTASVLRERLLLLQDQLQLVVQENVDLKKENARLKKQHKELAVQLEEYSLPEQFVEHRGVLFRKTGSGYSESPYCPVCKIPMSSMEQGVPFFCSRCDHITSLTPLDIPAVMERLKTSTGL
jgi:hypothetical protein